LNDAIPVPPAGTWTVFDLGEPFEGLHDTVYLPAFSVRRIDEPDPFDAPFTAKEHEPPSATATSVPLPPDAAGFSAGGSSAGGGDRSALPVRLTLDPAPTFATFGSGVVASGNAEISIADCGSTEGAGWAEAGGGGSRWGDGGEADGGDGSGGPFVGAGAAVTVMDADSTVFGPDALPMRTTAAAARANAKALAPMSVLFSKRRSRGVAGIGWACAGGA
jgi:hypothetical protein